MPLLLVADTEISNTFLPATDGTFAVYENNTTTLAEIYTDPDLTVALLNPVQLDGAGKSPNNVYVKDAKHTVMLRTAAGDTIYSRNDVFGWHQGLSDLQYDAGLPGSVPRPADEKLSDEVHVKDFGAVGDGVTDDLAAIQAAIDALSSSSGTGTVKFTGPYLISDEITTRSGIRLLGDGAPNTVIRAASSGFGSTKMVRNANWEATSITDSDISFENIKFDFNGNFAGGTHALYIRMVDRVRVIGCHFEDGNNSTAILACRDVLTQGCYAFNNNNSSFDHWDD